MSQNELDPRANIPGSLRSISIDEERADELWSSLLPLMQANSTDAYGDKVKALALISATLETPPLAAQDEAASRFLEELRRMMAPEERERYVEPIVGGPEGETVLGHNLKGGYWLMLQARLRNLITEIDRNRIAQIAAVADPLDYHKGIPVAAKLAAVKAYVARTGSCRPVAMLEALQAAAPLLTHPAAGRVSVSDAARDVLGERQRQVEAEGWTPEHDDSHVSGEMAGAAACYALTHVNHWGAKQASDSLWPWADEWWKPSDRRRNLVKAGALILAEIERLDRAASLSSLGGGE